MCVVMHAAVCRREAARQQMLRRAAARVGEERASTSIVRGKRHARLLTNLVSLRIPVENAAAQVRDMRLSPAAEVRDTCSCRVIPSAYSTRIEIGSGKYRGLVRVRRGMRWPAGLPYMPLEVISILHLSSTDMHVSTRTGRCCFTLFYSYFTPALLMLYVQYCCLSALFTLLLHYYFTPIL
jgi:hypothetical protein